MHKNGQRELTQECLKQGMLPPQALYIRVDLGVSVRCYRCANLRFCNLGKKSVQSYINNIKLYQSYEKVGERTPE